MNFQFDSVGLAAAVEIALAGTGCGLSGTPTTSPFPQFPLFIRGLRFLRRKCVGNRRWQQMQRQAHLNQLLAQIQQTLQASPKPALVYVVPFDIAKLQTGGGKRIAGLAKVLSTEFNVYIVSATAESASFSMMDVAPDCRLLSLPSGPDFLKKNRQVNAVPGAGIFTFSDHFDLLPEFQAVLKLLRDDTRAWMFESPVAWRVVQSFCLEGYPVCYDAPNDYALFLQSALGCKDERLVKRMVDLEGDTLSHVTVAAFCTARDQDSAKNRYPASAGKMLLVPNGVDISACRFLPPGEARAIRSRAGLNQNLAVFVGAYHKPNLEAIDQILLELAPAFPNLIFAVVGIHLNGYLNQGGVVPGDNVVFTGPVSEKVKGAIFALSDIALAPMKTGTGSSLKIPEYVAHGKIVVGTPIGLRGFEELQTFDSVVASEDVKGALNTVLARLERKPDSYSEPCHKAREWVAAHLEWALAAKPLVEAMKMARYAR